jgi:hypothetical protein
VPRYLAESQIIDWLVQLSLALKHIHDRKVGGPVVLTAEVSF